MVKGITQRWLVQSLGVTTALLVLLIFGLSFAVRSYYYDGVKNTLFDTGDEAVLIFSDMTEEKESMDTALKEYTECFDEEDTILLVIDESGSIILNSREPESELVQAMPDYEQAKGADNGKGCWTGSLNSGEKIMAHTRIITGKDGEYEVALRFVVSLANTDDKILTFIIVLIAGAMILLASFIIPSLFFIRTIVKPVRELRATSRRIAQGDFETHVTKQYDDEIGELADSINYMAKELKASDRMKNDFISSVSHELRTPLTAIKGWAETMSMGEIEPVTMNKGFSVIINETERLTGIVEELLDFSRIQNGRMVLVMDKVDLLAELDDAVYMLRERAISEKKHFIYDEPDHVSPVLGDKNRLRQVFINIIDNALKYTPTEGVIGIQVKEEHDMLRVIISDTGCGIAAKDLPRIKDKFYKANQKVRGSGIGLAVADEIMTLHKGGLEIESVEDVGTTVTISIPLLDSDDEEILKN